MSILETIIGAIAPHECMVCYRQGTPLCEACALDSTTLLPSRCFRCLRRTADFRTCINCRRLAKLRHVWPASEYSKIFAEIIKRYKYGRNRALARPLATLLDEALPYFSTPPLVVPIPTAPSRVRARGYDQTILLAKRLAAMRGWQCVDVLRREGSERQVGANRLTRLQQLDGTFRPIRSSYIENAEILLIDDVVTTGATLSVAANTLKKAGAKSISAAVIAHKS